MGGRSRAAAQLMSGQGFGQVYNLKGGIKAWQGIIAAGPAEEGLGLLAGDEGPQQVLAVAHALEENLERFYQQAMAQAADPEARQALARLAQAEDKHKASILSAYQDLAGPEAQPSFDAGHITEVGITPSQMIERYGGLVGEQAAVYQAAMALEAQALDLYLRYSQRMQQPEAAQTLHHLADEEKTHLKWLGALLDQEP